jgi:hypothetical protein
MAQPVESRVVLTLMLDMTHWRRHDRGHWAQVLANAADEAAPQWMQVVGYELGDTLLTLRLRSNRPAKQLRKLWNDHDVFLRLKARLADLGARADFEAEDEPG